MAATWMLYATPETVKVSSGASRIGLNDTLPAAASPLMAEGAAGEKFDAVRTNPFPPNRRKHQTAQCSPPYGDYWAQLSDYRSLREQRHQYRRHPARSRSRPFCRNCARLPKVAPQPESDPLESLP